MLKVRLKDIAAATGVSVQTVSLVLNDKMPGRIQEETRARVKEAARRMNYLRDMAASTLRGSKSMTIGLIQQRKQSGGFQELLFSVTRELNRTGYQALCVTPWEAADLPRLLREFEMRKVDGILILECIFPVDSSFLSIPVVRVHCDNPDVMVDIEYGSEYATRHLIEHGHQRIGIIGSDSLRQIGADPLRWNTNALKNRGRIRALGEAGLEDRPEWCIPVTWNPTFRESLARVIKRDRVTAFLCTNDYFAGKLCYFLKMHGYRIPDDIAVIGNDGMTFCEFTDPPLTTVRYPMREMGAAAVQRLLGMIAKPDAVESEPMLLKPQFHIGGSCGCTPTFRDQIYWEGPFATLHEQEHNHIRPEPELFEQWCDILDKNNDSYQYNQGGS